MLLNAALLAYPKEGWRTPIFFYVSELYWGRFHAQVSPEDVARHEVVKDLHQELVNFFSW